MQALLGFWLLCLLLVWQSALCPLAAGAQSTAGIRTRSGVSVESLVKNIFAKGACDNISNVRPIGSRDGIGYFDQGASTIGMDRGIILATGQIKHAEGPNQVTDRSGALGSSAGDPDLGIFVNARILDVVGIEFDFVPLDSFVTFRYVFASEEYCEFVGSVYNDVFGFFVSGPGINGNFSNGAANVALIPGTKDYVAINSVNHTYNSQYFVRNDLERDARQCGIPPMVSPHRNFIEYDGFTTVLTATLQLVPCETYHIRLVVADVTDRFYDSAVFLEAESFNIGGTVKLSAQAQEGNRAVEGCQDAWFVFQRGERETLNKPLTVQFKISPESTAEEGKDFAPLPRRFTIPAGQMQARLPVQFFNDGINESIEKLKIELDIPCACYTGSAELLVSDAPEMRVRLPDTTVCRQNLTNLQPYISGGVGPFTYRWSTGATTPALPITPSAPGDYAVTVTDRCGTVAADSNSISIIEPPQAVLSGAAEICAGDTAWLSVQLSGRAPWRIDYTINGISQPQTLSITTEHYLLPATRHGVYQLQKVTDAVCNNTGIGRADVNVIEIQANAQIQPVRCAGGQDGAIRVAPAGGTLPYRLRWEHVALSDTALHQLPTGNYRLVITDANGCVGRFNFKVPEPMPLQPVVYDCADLTNPRFHFSANGGTPPYQYSINGVDFFDHNLFKSLTPGDTYSLIIRDAYGCELRQSFALPPRYDRLVELPSVLKVKIGTTFDIKPRLNIPEALVANIRWLSSEPLSCLDCLVLKAEALRESRYTVRINDVFGCSGEATVRIELDREVDVYVPSAFTPNEDQTNDRLTVYVNERQVRRVLSFQIFNRWGDLVFAKENFAPNNESEGWDGRHGRERPNPGVYVYVAKLELIDGSEVVRQGHVMLIK